MSDTKLEEKARAIVMVWWRSCGGDMMGAAPSLVAAIAKALAAQRPPLGHLIDDKGVTRRIGGVEVYDDRVMFTCRRKPGETFTLWGDAALAATPNAKGTK